jgi:hypothetical protein
MDVHRRENANPTAAPIPPPAKAGPAAPDARDICSPAVSISRGLVIDGASRGLGACISEAGSWLSRSSCAARASREQQPDDDQRKGFSHGVTPR